MTKMWAIIFILTGAVATASLIRAVEIYHGYKQCQAQATGEDRVISYLDTMREEMAQDQTTQKKPKHRS